MLSRKHVIINGGGIAGLSAALAFAKSGWYVEVFERAAAIEPFGAGIQLTPNMFSALTHIDKSLIKQIRIISTHPDEITIHTAGKKKMITSIPLGRQTEIKYGFPYTVIHRADLHNILLAACEAQPDIEIHFSSSVVDYAKHKNGITALIKQKTDFRESSCRLLIVADGVNSELREKKLNLPKAKDSGKIAWRCLIPESRVEDKRQLRRISLQLANKRHVVAYPVRGGAYLNLVAIMDKSLTPETTKLSGKEMAELFKFWPVAFKRQLNMTPEWTGWPLMEMEHYDMPEEESIAIIGDAAHAMLPFAAQGASMAVEDAVILAQHVNETEDLQEALHNFYKARYKRINRVAKLARTNGIYYHDTGIMAFMRNLFLKLTPSKAILARQKWVYNWRP